MDLLAGVSVVPGEQSAANRERFWQETLADREVVSVFDLAIAVDYLVEVLVRDTALLGASRPLSPRTPPGTPRAPSAACDPRRRRGR